MNSLDKLNQSTIDSWLALQVTVRAIQTASGDGRWLAVNVTMAQLKVALLLVQSGGLPSRAIAERLAIGPSAVTPLVDRLVALKLARRDADPTDRRVVCVRPTPKALALHESLLQTGRTILVDVLKEVPESEREQVGRALSVLRDSAARVHGRILKERAAK